MKKYILYALAIVALFGSTSCEDPIDSVRHEYTPEELDRAAYLDSIKQRIPATYVFEQNITIPVSKGYGGVTVTLDGAKLCEVFGYPSVEQLVAALGTLENGQQVGHDITFYAYNFSTKYAVTNPSTTNYFGHWFDANGDVCSWGDQAFLFCEKQDETSLNFTIGLFPGHVQVDSVYHIVEAMKYDKISVAIQFNVTIGPKEVIPVPTVKGTTTLEFETDINNDYVPEVLAIDAAAIQQAIGMAPESANLYGVLADNSLYTDGYTANVGYWFNTSGNVCNWGTEGCVMGAEYDAANQKINVFQFPDGPQGGQTYTVTMAFVNGLNQYNVVIKMKMKKPPYTLEFETEINNDYAPVSLSLDVAAVTEAIGTDPALASLYGINADNSLYTSGFTANNGYWFNTSGDVCNWGTEGCVIGAEYDAANQKINVFQFPDGPVPGETYTARLAFVNSGKQFDVIIKMTIKESAPEYPVTIKTGTINLVLTVPVNNEYAPTALALDSAAVHNAIGCGPSAAKLYGYNETTDSLYFKGFTANNGYWYNFAGDVCNWGTTGCTMFAEYSPAEQAIHVGQFPEACVSGKVYKCTLAFVNGNKRINVVIVMTVQ